MTEDGGEGLRVGIGRALELEERRHRGPRVLVERLVPSERTECLVEVRSGPGVQRVTEAPLEQDPLRLLHQ